MATLLESLRSRLVAWTKTATLEQLGELPSEIFEGGSGGNGNGHRRRLPRKVRRPITRAEADEIRLELKKYEGTPEYFENRDRICRDRGFTRRQLGAVVSGLERAKGK